MELLNKIVNVLYCSCVYNLLHYHNLGNLYSQKILNDFLYAKFSYSTSVYKNFCTNGNMPTHAAMHKYK